MSDSLISKQHIRNVPRINPSLSKLNEEILLLELAVNG